MTPLPTIMSKQSPPWKHEEMKILKDFETKTIKVEKELWASKILNELSIKTVKTVEDLLNFLKEKSVPNDDCSTLIDKIIGIPNINEDPIVIEEFSQKYADSLIELVTKKKEMLSSLTRSEPDTREVDNEHTVSSSFKSQRTKNELIQIEKDINLLT